MHTAATALLTAAAVLLAPAPSRGSTIWRMEGCRLPAGGVFRVSADADCDSIEMNERESPCVPTPEEGGLTPYEPLTFPMTRLVPCAYVDGISVPPMEGLPSARAVSNAVASQSGPLPSAQRLSDFFWQWGQLIDHDIILTHAQFPPVSINIPVPAGDPEFDPLGEGGKFIAMTRTEPMDGEGPREFANLITPELDASMVYGGHDEVRAAALRANDGTGRMATSAGGLLPLNDAGLANEDGGDPEEGGTYLAGDTRANEQSALTAAHTLFVREHNRVADEVRAAEPGLSGDDVYWRARRRVAAEMQAITYEEWLPLLLGPGAVPPYDGHKPGVSTAVTNEFGAACFRFGHTMLASALRRDTNEGPAPEGPLPLRNAFFDSADIAAHGIDSLLLGLARQVAQEVDLKVVDDVRNFLFGPPGAGGLDLFSLNVQRGRDHGLPRYVRMREAAGLSVPATFLEVTGGNAETADALASVYDSVADVDLFVGGLAEPHAPGAAVGATFRYVIAEQFTRLRDGDPDFYLASPDTAAAAGTRLADVVRRNTVATAIQDDAFVVPE